MNRLLPIAVLGILLMQIAEFCVYRYDTVLTDRNYRNQVTVQETRINIYDGTPYLNITLNNTSGKTLSNVDLMVSVMDSNGAPVYQESQSAYSVPTGIYHAASVSLSPSEANSYTYKVTIMRASDGY